MQYEDSKRTKRLRLILCTFFVLITACTALPFYVVSDGTRAKVVTDLELIMRSFMNGEIWAGFLFLLFILVPAAGFFIAVFDRKSRFKAIAGLVCSVLGVAFILFLLTPANISLGAMFSLLLYILSFLVSMYLLLIKTGERQQLAEQAKKKEEQQEHLVIKLDKTGAATAKKQQPGENTKDE